MHARVHIEEMPQAPPRVYYVHKTGICERPWGCGCPIAPAAGLMMLVSVRQYRTVATTYS